MSDRRKEIEAKAMDIVGNWQAEADPARALEALQKAAPQDMGAIFAMLGSELALVMNEIEERSDCCRCGYHLRGSGVQGFE